MYEAVSKAYNIEEPSISCNTSIKHAQPTIHVLSSKPQILNKFQCQKINYHFE